MKKKIFLNIRFISGLLIVVTIFLMFLGPWVRAADAGLACPDWPKCYGAWIPPSLFDYQVFLEWIHRLVALITTVLFIYLFFCIFAKDGTKKERKLVSFAGLVLAIQIVLGGMTVIFELQPTIVNLHLTTALIFLSLLFVIWWQRKNPELAKAKTIRPPFSLGLIFIAIFFQIVTGGRMSSNQAGLICDSFPACYYVQTDDATKTTPVYIPDLNIRAYEIHFTHRWGGVLIFAFLVGLFFYSRKRDQQWSLQRRNFLTGLTILYALQILLGATNVWLRIPIYITVFHSLFAYFIHLSALGAILCNDSAKKGFTESNKFSS